nr:PREDICTED: far upstream element-binding protein 2-like [Linepithema humile]
MKELVLLIVNQRSRGIDDVKMSGGSGRMMGHPGFVEINIPDRKVDLIIGKGRETIKQLQEKSEVKMIVIQEEPSKEQEKPLRYVFCVEYGDLAAGITD